VAERDDPWCMVQFGATSTRDRDDLEEVKRQLHDAIIEQLGDNRTGPVSWRWWPAPVGLRILDEREWTPNDGGLRRFLRTNPGGYLVLASAPSSHPEDTTPLDRAPCGCQWGTVDDAFIFEPCSTDCDLLEYVQAEATRTGKPLTTLDMRGGGRG
jgi:hypothetical protein